MYCQEAQVHEDLSDNLSCALLKQVWLRLVLVYRKQLVVWIRIKLISFFTKHSICDVFIYVTSSHNTDQKQMLGCVGGLAGKDAKLYKICQTDKAHWTRFNLLHVTYNQMILSNVRRCWLAMPLKNLYRFNNKQQVCQHVCWLFKVHVPLKSDIETSLRIRLGLFETLK